MTKTVFEAIDYRRSVRVYDQNIEINNAIVKECIEKATLAPTSSNMQLWEFHHISSEKTLQAMHAICLDQNAAKTAKAMLVVVVKKDAWRKRRQANLDFLLAAFGKKDHYSKREQFALNYYRKLIPTIYFDFLGIFGFLKRIAFSIMGIFKPTYRQVRASDMRVVAHKSAALAAQTFMLAMASKNYDTCPMEGFDSLRVKNLLNIPSSSEISMVISCGTRTEEGIYGPRFRVPFESVYKEW